MGVFRSSSSANLILDDRGIIILVGFQLSKLKKSVNVTIDKVNKRHSETREIQIDDRMHKN